MAPLRYFVRPLPGTPHQRYFILAGERTVARVQLSCPDGVPEPAHLRFVRPHVESAPLARPQINPPLRREAKPCTRCQRELPRAEFYASAGRIKSWCRACISEYKRQRKAHGTHPPA